MKDLSTIHIAVTQKDGVPLIMGKLSPSENMTEREAEIFGLLQHYIMSGLSMASGQLQDKKDVLKSLIGALAILVYAGSETDTNLMSCAPYVHSLLVTMDKMVDDFKSSYPDDMPSRVRPPENQGKDQYGDVVSSAFGAKPTTTNETAEQVIARLFGISPENLFGG